MGALKVFFLNFLAFQSVSNSPFEARRLRNMRLLEGPIRSNSLVAMEGTE